MPFAGLIASLPTSLVAVIETYNLEPCIACKNKNTNPKR